VGSADSKKFWCNIPRDTFDVERYEGTEEDERKVFYVAITRVKDVLVLSYFGDMINSSSFVKNLDGRISPWLANGEHLLR
jgi:superfamily I DNA/RNA helicase